MPLHFETTQARTDEEIQAVGAFRYRCYLSEGLIAPRDDGMLLDEYDYVEATRTFVVRLRGKIAGTIRLHILDDQNHNSATMSAFSDILLPKVQSGESLIDAARFAVDPDLGALRLSVARQTLRLYANLAETRAVDYGVAAVQESRIEFYRRLYGFSQISEPRSYDKLCKKLVLMGVDLKCRSNKMTGTHG